MTSSATVVDLRKKMLIAENLGFRAGPLLWDIQSIDFGALANLKIKEEDSRGNKIGEAFPVRG